MTPLAIAYLAAGGIALLLATTVLVLMPDATTRRLRDRARDAAGTADRVVAGPKQSIRVDAPAEHTVWSRFAEALGHNRNIPPPYAASIPMVILTSGFAGLVMFWQMQSSFGGAVGILLGAGLALALARFQLRRKAAIYTQLLFTQMPDALALVVRSIRSGQPVGDALRSVGTDMPSPTRDEFSRMMGEVALGVPLDTAVWSLYRRTRLREYSFLAVTLSLHAQTGGNLGETLDNLGSMIRRRVALVGKVRALTAEARASVLILSCLPFVSGLAIMVLNPEYMTEMFTDPRGKNFLLVFAAMMSSGLLVMRWLMNRSTRD
jgi:tight adherence protein B